MVYSSVIGPATVHHPWSIMTVNSITLVGRNSEVALSRTESGSAFASFSIVIKRGEQTATIPCEAWGKLAEKAATMEKGMLIGLIGPLTKDKKVRLDCLEILAGA
jgi:single-stranded DNA-binding protein